LLDSDANGSFLSEARAVDNMLLPRHFNKAQNVKLPLDPGLDSTNYLTEKQDERSQEN